MSFLVLSPDWGANRRASPAPMIPPATSMSAPTVALLLFSAMSFLPIGVIRVKFTTRATAVKNEQRLSPSPLLAELLDVRSGSLTLLSQLHPEEGLPPPGVA